MKFNPEKCRMKDERMKPFIDTDEIWDLLDHTKPDRVRVKETIAKSLEKNRLTLEETALLINATETDLVEEIKQGARELKKTNLWEPNRFIRSFIHRQQMHQ